MNFYPSQFSLLRRHWAAFLASITAVFYIVLSTVHFSNLVSHSETPDLVVTQPATRNDDTVIQSIIHQSWFGRDPEEQPESVAENNFLADFELNGISASGSQRFAGAYISYKSQADEYYRIGDGLPDNAGTVENIASDLVAVRHNGDLIMLRLPGADGTRAGKTVSATNAKSPFFALPPEKNFDLPAMSNAEIVKNFISSPKTLLAEAGLHPIKDGQKKGYVFDGSDPQGVFDGSGIQKNDVILAVDGNLVGDPSSERLLAAKLELAKTFKLDIQRSGQHIMIDYSLPQ